MGLEAHSWSVRRLRAAFWVGHVLGREGEDAEFAHESWANLPLGGNVDFADLRTAEQALIEIGLVDRDDELLRPVPELAACTESETDDFEPLLALILDSEAPLWLRTAAPDGSTFKPELLPVEIQAALAMAFPDPGRREAFLLARAVKVELGERERLGGEGEEAVVRACRVELTEIGRQELAAAVRRVSLISDELGYDVTAPRLDGSVRRLETKATRSQADSCRVFVTRNELATGLADPDWFLVVVRCTAAGEESILGHLGAAALEPFLPVDQSLHGLWQSAALRLSIGDLTPGLPPA